MTEEQIEQLREMAEHFREYEDEGEELDCYAARKYQAQLRAIIEAEAQK